MSEQDNRRVLQDAGVIVARVADDAIQVRLRDDFTHFDWVPAKVTRGELLRLPLEIAAALGQQLVELAEDARDE